MADAPPRRSSSRRCSTDGGRRVEVGRRSGAFAGETKCFTKEMATGEVSRSPSPSRLLADNWSELASATSVRPAARDAHQQGRVRLAVSVMPDQLLPAALLDEPADAVREGVTVGRYGGPRHLRVRVGREELVSVERVGVSHQVDGGARHAGRREQVARLQAPRAL